MKIFPMIASIIAVADTFDAMTTDRPYRKGLSKENAIRPVWFIIIKSICHCVAADRGDNITLNPFGISPSHHNFDSLFKSG